MKRLGVFLVCALMLFLALSCNKKASGPEINKSTDNTDLIGPGKGPDYGLGPIGFDFDGLVNRLGPEAVKRLHIGVSTPSFTAEWYTQWAEEAQNLAKKYGFRVTVLSGENNATKQAEDLKALQSQSVDGIVEFAMNASALSSTITEIYKSGVPIVSCVPSAPGTQLSTSVNVSQEAKGYMIAEHAAAEANGEIRNILMLNKATDMPIIQSRLNGFIEGAAKYPNLKIVVERRDNTADGVLNQSKEAFLTNEEINMVITPGEAMLEPAQRAALDLGRAGSMYFYGISTSDESSILMLKAGTLTGMHVQFGRPQMAVCMFNMLRAIGGEQLPEYVWEPEAYAMFYCTKDNADLALKLLYPDRYK